MLIAATSFAACTLDKTPGASDGAVTIEDAGKPSSGFDASGVILLAPGARHAKDAGIDAGDMTQTGSSGSGAAPDAGSSRPYPHKDAGTHPASSDAGAGKPPATKPPVKPQPCGGACTSDKPRCLQNGMCAQCAFDTDCHPGTPRCDTQSFTCVACVSNADCAAPTPACDVAAHVCRPCIDDSQCTGNAKRCDTTAHACVQCLDDSTCAGMHCNIATHGCVQCLVNSDCTTHAQPECNNHVCSLCTSDAACAGRPGAGACDAVGGNDDDQGDDEGGSSSSGGSGACVECTQSNTTACASGMCNGGQNHCGIKPPPPPPVAPCTSCQRDRDCSSGQSCSSVRIAGRRIASFCVPSGNAACLASCAVGLTLGCN